MTYSAQEIKLFNYTGGKSKYYNHFEKLHTKTNIKQVHTYIEAFGGTLSSLFHNLQNIKANRIIINDYNSKLTNLYTQIKNNFDEVIDNFLFLENVFQELIPEEFKGKGLIKDKLMREEHLGHLRDYYNRAREVFNENKSHTLNASLFLFIMQHNFNGLYRESKKGSFNITFNWTMKKINTDKIVKNITNLHHFLNKENVIIENLECFELIEKYKSNKSTLIYLDPPYIDSSMSYLKQKNDYSNIDTHLNLIEYCKDFDYVMYSNNYNKSIEEAMDFTINFTRTNMVAQNTEQTSKKEILGFIDNTIKTIDIANNIDFEKKYCLTTGILFNGIGSTTQALINSNTNFKTKFICDIDKYARQVYLENFDEPEIIYEDITKIDLETIPYVDFLQMSPPCVSFSRQNHNGKGLKDERGNLVFDSLKILEKIKPKYFLFENVSALLDKKHIKDFEIILDFLENLDYKIHYDTLNSKDFNTPQNRDRLFIIGIRNDIKNNDFEFPIGDKKRVVLNDYIQENEDYSDFLWKYEEKHLVKENKGPRSMFNLAYSLSNLTWDGNRNIFSSDGLVPCFLSSNCHTKIIDTKHNIFRYMTIREKKLIQGFPEDFSFESVSKTQALKQLGNTITVPVLNKLIENMHLEEYKKISEDYLEAA